MAKYPTTPIPSYEHVTQARYKTVISIFDDGNEQRRQKWTAPQYDITLQYNAIRATAMSTIWNFFEARKGAYEAFHYYIGEAWGEKQDVKGAYIAVADGTATAFTLQAAGKGTMAGFNYTIDQSAAKTSAITASGWAAESASCWIIRKGGGC